ncbi:MAG: serine hydrolase domain-containing protein [Rikenellaceae bacterium]
MKKLLALSFALFFGLSASLFGQDNQDNQAIIKNIEAYAKKVQQDWKIPGMAMSIMKDGELIYAKGFGVKDKSGVDPVDGNTVFQIGSISKSFTAAIMATLVDEGKIKWDDTVKNILPDFKMYDKWVEANLQVKDIMTHHTGLPDQSGTYIPNLGYNRDDIYKMLSLIKPGYSFRGNYEYNNITFVIASKIIEKLTGKSWEDNIKERIFDKVGMANTSVNEEGFRNSKNVATPHEFLYKKGRIINDSTWVDSIEVNPLYGDEQALNWLTVIGPAGAVNSTAADMARYAQFHLNNGTVKGKEIITGKSMDYLHKGQTITSQDSARITLYAHCWFVEQNSRYRLYFHTGTTWGFTALCAFVPEQKLAMVILINSEAPASPRYAIMRRLIDLYKGYPDKDYSAAYLQDYLKSEREDLLKSDKKTKDEAKKEAPKEAPKQELLLGSYDKGELFGKAVITKGGEDLYITVGPKGWKHKMTHKNGEEFTFRSDGHEFPVKFIYDKKGKKIVSLDINFGYNENFGAWRKVK